jgi:hypothetical protein
VKRSTVITDRVATAAAGLGVLALGASAAAWQLGRLPVPPDSTLQIDGLDAIVGAPWWPYALVVVALVLIAVGVRWLYAHRPGQSVGATTLPNSSAAGELTLDLDTAASAAAAALLENPCVASASGTSRIDRGERIIQLDVTLGSDPGALAAVTDAVRVVSADLAGALDGVPFTSRVLLRTSRGAGRAPRVS